MRELQSLIGKLNFVAHYVKPARIFISRLLNWLRQIQNTDSSQVIPLETKKDLIWWFHLLPKYNGVSMMDFEEWSEPDQLCATDACLVGAGGTFADSCFHCEFPNFIRKENLHINNLELLTIDVAVKLWGQKLCNSSEFRFKSRFVCSVMSQGNLLFCCHSSVSN